MAQWEAIKPAPPVIKIVFGIAPVRRSLFYPTANTIGTKWFKCSTKLADVACSFVRRARATALVGAGTWVTHTTKFVMANRLQEP